MPRFSLATTLALAAALWSSPPCPALGAQDMASGSVFEDGNANGRRDPGEPGIAGVAVSNQLEVVLTDQDGRWQLPVANETIFFVTQPVGYRVPVNGHNLPSFYFIHQPAGSPESVVGRFRGIEATGPLPESIDFPLLPHEHPQRFQLIALADPQSRNDRELDFLRDDVVAELAGSQAALAIVAGDILFDDLALYPRHNRIMSAMGLPVWSVSGNHDVDYASPDDLHSLETFKGTYGPHYYSFDYGQVHFVVLDNVEYQGRAAGAESARGGGGYRGYVDEKQLQWLSNDLGHVAQDRLVVICTHIPLSNARAESDSTKTVNASAVLQTLEGRDRVLLLAGHMHTTDHSYLTKEDGWLGARPLHQHMLTAACGVWWRGPFDERGIPFSSLSDGGENGYHVYSFDGTSYSSRFKAASRAESYQLRIHIDAEYKNDEYGGLAFSQLGQQGGILRSEQVPSTLLVANVFSAGERATVSLHLDGGPPHPMTRRLRTDPRYVELYERQAPTKQGQIPLSEPDLSSHVWETRLPSDLARGIHVARVEVTDQFGQVFQAVKIFEVVEP